MRLFKQERQLKSLLMGLSMRGTICKRLLLPACLTGKYSLRMLWPPVDTEGPFISQAIFGQNTARSLLTKTFSRKEHYVSPWY